MKTNHTPGPWVVHHERGSEWALVMSGGPAGRIICNVNPESCPDTSSAPAFVRMPMEANARLIAAAPDLLDALSDLLERIERSPTLLPHISADSRNAARAAIAKATPGTHQ